MTEEEQKEIDAGVNAYIEEEVSQGRFPLNENIVIFKENERRWILGQDLGAPPRVWLSRITQIPTPVPSQSASPNLDEAQEGPSGSAATPGKRTCQKSTTDDRVVELPSIRISQIRDADGFFYMPPNTPSSTNSKTPSPNQNVGNDKGDFKKGGSECMWCFILSRTDLYKLELY